MKKLLAFMTSAVLLFTAGCGGGTGGGTGGGGKLSDVEIWTVDASEKILQNRVDIYGDFKSGSELNISAAKNEYESGRIVMTAKEDIAKYDVIASDLKIEGGTEVFSKDNILLYNEKYTYLGAVGKEYYKLDGYYPDAILPFDAAKKSGENKIKKDNNQSVYVTFNVPAEQKAGIYKGSVAVEIGGEKHNVPVSLKIYDIAVSETVNAKSAFSLNWYLQRGEVDTSMDMRKLYFDKLAEYRLSGYSIVRYETFTQEEMDYFAETAAEYAKNPKVASLKMPARQKTAYNYRLDGVVHASLKILDIDAAVNYMLTLAYKSFEEDVDILSKMFIYIIDEPELGNASWEEVRALGLTFAEAKTKTLAALDADRSISSPLLASVKQSIQNMSNIVTINSYQGDMGDTTYCPYFVNMHNEKDREYFETYSQNGVWWYGCNIPTNPYPTYHIDDTLLSARLASWVQYDYNIDGNLYWAVDSWSAGSYQYTEDYYYTEGRTASANGEGLLVYPGKIYGVEGPVASLRLEAIRDGLEEYEILRSLELNYNTLGYSSQSIRNLITDALYSGTAVNTTKENMNASRAGLYSLYELAESKAGVRISSASMQGGKYVFEVYAKDGYTLKNGETVLNQFVTKNGGKVYTVTVDMSAGQNKLQLSAEVDGKVLGFEWYLGGSAVVYGAETFEDSFIERNASLETVKVDASSVDASLDGKLLQIKLGLTAGKAQDVLMSHSVIQQVGTGTSKLIITLYNASSEEKYFKMQFKYSKRSVFTQVLETPLVPGINKFEFNNIYTYNWAANGYIEQIHFVFGTAAGSVANDWVYLKDIAVYGR